MVNRSLKNLLPAGLEDLLPPEADYEEFIVRKLSDYYTRYGYQRVKPPLLEFETSLLDGIGATVSEETFRLMDPISQRMMGLRADMTPQVARLAATRLQGAPRPLRLMYNGEVLRVKGGHLRPNRQFRAVGVELIGSAKTAKADSEVIVIAAESMNLIGVNELSVDLNVPSMAGIICDEYHVSQKERAELLGALNRKDVSAIEKSASNVASYLLGLLEASGSALEGLVKLEQLDLPGEAAGLACRLKEVVGLVLEEAPDLKVTIDAADSRGFEYHTGVSFSFFARDSRAELGAGGRYLLGGSEPATGFTLFTDVIMAVAQLRTHGERIFLPVGTNRNIMRKLQEEGWLTVNGLVAEEDLESEATRLHCKYVWLEGRLQKLKDEFSG